MRPEKVLIALTVSVLIMNGNRGESLALDNLRSGKRRRSLD
jgi:hypothetical protein